MIQWYRRKKRKLMISLPLWVLLRPKPKTTLKLGLKTPDNIDAGTKPETEAEPKVQAEADTDIPTDPATEAIETLKLTCHPSVYNRIVEMYKRVSGVYLFNLFNIFIVYNIYILYIVIMLYMFLMCIDEYHVSDVW